MKSFQEPIQEDNSSQLSWRSFFASITLKTSTSLAAAAITLGGISLSFAAFLEPNKGPDELVTPIMYGSYNIMEESEQLTPCKKMTVNSQGKSYTSLNLGKLDAGTNKRCDDAGNLGFQSGDTIKFNPRGEANIVLWATNPDDVMADWEDRFETYLALQDDDLTWNCHWSLGTAINEQTYNTAAFPSWSLDGNLASGPAAMNTGDFAVSDIANLAADFRPENVGTIGESTEFNYEYAANHGYIIVSTNGILCTAS